MGGRRLQPQRPGPGKRRNVERQASTPQSKTAGPSHTNSHGGNSIQRMKDLQTLVGNSAVSKLLEKKPDLENNTSARDALMKLSRETFERVIDRLPSLFGPAARLAPTSTVPGQDAGQLSAVMEMGASLVGLLAELDQAIHQFEKAGGELTEIQPIVAIRAQLSTSLFFLNQIQAGAPLGPQLLQCIQEVALEGTKYRVELAIKKALEGAGEVDHGPKTESQQSGIETKLLQWRLLFLGEPGKYPSAPGLKSA
jgi:hypothetical protein